MNSLYLFLLLLFFSVYGIVQAKDRDCIHDEYPGIQVIYEEAIKSSNDDSCQLNDDAINKESFQKRCSLFDNSGSPFKCTLDKDKSITINPEPLLSDFEPQGRFGGCYIGAALANLQYNLAEIDKNGIRQQQKYSLSDAICAGNKELYKNGGMSIASLMMIAKNGELLECRLQKMSHNTAVKKMEKEIIKCNNDGSPFYKSIEEIERNVARKVKKMNEQCVKNKTPSFTIQEIPFEKDNESLSKIAKMLKKNKMVLAVMPGHEINIYGINTYNCKNGEKSLKIKTVKILDPNGVKMEVIANDLSKGISEQHELFYLNKEDKTIEIRDIYSGPSGIVYAAATGDTDILKAYLNEDGPNINNQFYDGTTPLFVAAQNGHEEVIAELLKVPGIDVNKAMNDGTTPLFMAAQNGHNKVVETLLNAKEIDVNKATNDGVTPLFIASQQGHSKVVEALLSAKEIDVNKARITNGVTPLFMAAQKGYIEVVEQLLKAPGIDVNKVINSGVTPLFVAVQKRHIEVVKALLKVPGINLDIKFEGKTVEKFAIEKKFPEISALINAKVVEITKGVAPDRPPYSISGPTYEE